MRLHLKTISKTQILPPWFDPYFSILGISGLRSEWVIVPIRRGLETVGNYLSRLTPRGPHDTLAIALNQMAESLQTQEWLQNGEIQLNNRLNGDHHGLTKTCQQTLEFVARYGEAQLGVFYVVTGEKLELTASYAYAIAQVKDRSIAIGEGKVGQAALDKKVLIFDNIPKDHIALNIDSCFGKLYPQTIAIFPVVYNGKTEGVLELAFTIAPVSRQMVFLGQAMRSIAIAVYNTRAKHTSAPVLR